MKSAIFVLIAVFLGGCATQCASSACHSPFYDAHIKISKAVDGTSGPLTPEQFKAVMQVGSAVRILHDGNNHFDVEVRHMGVKLPVWDSLENMQFVSNVDCDFGDTDYPTMAALRGNIHVMAGDRMQWFHTIWIAPNITRETRFAGALLDLSDENDPLCHILLEDEAWSTSGEAPGIHQGQWHSKP